MVQTAQHPSGRGSLYYLTDAGQDLWDVMIAVGTWGERWLELAPDHIDPGVVLWSWCNFRLDHDRLPERRVVVRFEFADQPKGRQRFWLILDHDQSEVCRTDPGFHEELIVEAESKALAEWHLGRITWDEAIRSDRIRVLGSSPLARMLPTWNRLSGFAEVEPIGSATR